MGTSSVIDYIKDVLKNMPAGWLEITTHRLDIYNEQRAKVEFIEQFDTLYAEGNAATSDLDVIPTAYDYIRLGHPLSCVLEWVIAKEHGIDSTHVISFSSQTIGLLAVLRKNLLDGKKTRINHVDKLPNAFDEELLKKVYGYNFELKQVTGVEEVEAFDGSQILIAKKSNITKFDVDAGVDFVVNTHPVYGSIVLVHESNADYISAIQHVRRRETIAMTPINCQAVLEEFISSYPERSISQVEKNKKFVIEKIQEITDSGSKAVVGSSGLSIQYAIMMGLIHDANEQHPGKKIKFVVPPNCYGGTNDQARRVAACLDHVEIVDLPVDGDNDMVQSIHQVLSKIAYEDAIPYIIAEIPTNPRVEVPDLQKLQEALSIKRKTASGNTAIDPVFILDQTFCPNVHFLGENKMLSTVRTISYASGSKFPSGGKCTAGYAIGNTKTTSLMDKIEQHLLLCDNEATSLQYELLAQQLPSMIDRIHLAYLNTRSFVNFIKEVLPEAKINFVSEELANQGFTPSVFSLDLPTKGETAEDKETYKRALNHRLIRMMITEIPLESKYCVSYGQLKGCYWTIPATSTQGTTKEGDKDYIARVAMSANMDLEKHKEVFRAFVATL